MELNSQQKRQRILLEIKDFLVGAAFPFMLQLVLSASVILFADANGEPAIQAFALVVGEIMLIAAYVIFGRQNGISAYRKTLLGEKKRDMGTSDTKSYFRTGEYAIWKGVVIGAISVVPFVLFQFIQCLIANSFCEFILKYAFGWATYPFLVFGIEIGWLNFIWIVIPIGVHTLAYFWGGLKERKRQALLEKAQEIKGKGKK